VLQELIKILRDLISEMVLVVVKQNGIKRIGSTVLNYEVSTIETLVLVKSFMLQ